MLSLFSKETQNKFAREIKPEEFAKKKATLTPRLDDEEQARQDIKAAKNLEKKAKRKVKPRKGASESTASENDKSKASTSTAAPTGDGNSKDERTVFFGNVPISYTVKSLTKFCSEFGEVESVRLRSLPIAGTAVDEAGNQELVKKVCAMKKDFGKQKGSLNAYVVFKSSDSVKKALKANNRVLSIGDDEDNSKEQKGNGKGNKAPKGRHLRVDLLNPTLFDPSLSVFIGGVPHYADEEEMREHFAAALPNGQKDIKSVRLVRDAESLIGKGFGYILLSDKDAVMQALTLHQKMYRKRWELRVTVCGKRTKRTKDGGSNSQKLPSGGSSTSSASKKRKIADKEEEEEDEEGEGEDENTAGSGAAKEKKTMTKKKPRWRDLSEEDLAAKKAASAKEISKNAAAAMKRITKAGQKIQKGTKNTRTNVLKGKGQMKKVAGKKGKRLGGNVKRAMKAEKAKNKGSNQ